MVALKNALERLPKGAVYLHTPTEMKVGEQRCVDASVGVNVPDEILRGHSHPGEQTVGGELRLSYEMIATLIGPGFAISPITPEKQTVAEGSPTVWQWQIEAKQEGLRELEATLYALITIDAANPTRQRINSYSQKVNVSVKPQTWAEWLKSVRDEVDAVTAIAVTLGGVATAVLGWLGISATRRARSPSQSKPKKPSAQAAKPRYVRT